MGSGNELHESSQYNCSIFSFMTVPAPAPRVNVKNEEVMGMEFSGDTKSIPQNK